ncbi:MAG: hypothetical protein M3Z05_23155, partial [Gemmatimonadota bacterium]|nr:hypothetical protein [Gemmatimonadota bacterium]
MRTVTEFGVIALLLVWGAYPLTVRLLASLVSLRGKPPQRSLPTVSLVLASAEDAGAIRTRVVDLLRTTYPGHLLEVIVALDAVRG